MLRNSACDRPIYIVATLTETRLKQIIIEELVEHYLVQRYLWDDDDDEGHLRGITPHDEVVRSEHVRTNRTRTST